jgi:hypothetical protein
MVGFEPTRFGANPNQRVRKESAMSIEFDFEFESEDFEGGCYFGCATVEGDVNRDYLVDDRGSYGFLDATLSDFVIVEAFDVDEFGEEKQVVDEDLLHRLAEHLYYKYETRLSETLMEEYDNRADDYYEED